MSRFNDKIVGVLLGGLSKEREISLKSGQAVLDALLVKGYDAVPVDVGRDVDAALQDKGVEVAFLALHGRYGEDGSIQGLLEIRGIPYTGSSVLASALAMDKYLTKELVRRIGIAVPDDYFFDAVSDDLKTFLKKNTFSYPLIVKPSREGSTIGIARVEDDSQLQAAITAAARLDSRVLVEKFVQGREVTVGILNGQPLPVLEVRPKKGFYDFEAKYTVGATEYFCPADLPPALASRLQEDSLKVYRLLSCEGVARADFIISESQTPYFLEINTLPGMTATSLVPKAARAAGISFEDLVEKILLSARLKVE
jgi:D-alanine-D-alanine ligase